MLTQRIYFNFIFIVLLLVQLSTEELEQNETATTEPTLQAILSKTDTNNETLQEKISPTITTEARISENICPSKVACVPLIQCPAHVYEGVRSCSTKVGTHGVCCTTGQNHTSYISTKGRGHEIIHVDPLTLGLLATRSRWERAQMQIKENYILNSEHPTTLMSGSPSYDHFRNKRVFGSSDLHQVMDVATRALEIAIATREFKNRRGISIKQLEFGRIQEDLRPTPLGSSCRPIPHCHHIPEKYRRIDGTCNNVKHPSWGSPLTPYSRLLPPSYRDGIWIPRVSELNGKPLPSPRLISTTVFNDADRPNYDYTLMLMQFGQFLSHDLTQSLDNTYPNGTGISCCTPDGKSKFPPQFTHYACMPIEISQYDPFYSQFKQNCMNFVRSVLSPRHDCKLGYADQMNKVTHFLDGSAIYGSSPDQTHELRSFQGGEMKVFNDFGREMLPLTHQKQACLTMDRGSACFKAGDTRNNQMVSLVVIHTLFVREHNRIARALREINPHYDDELLFLESRRIVIAELQAITYKEFLPSLLGEAAMAEFNIGLKERGYSYDYDAYVEPSVNNEFAAAGFRFGHSMVYGLLKLYGMKDIEEFINIPEIMFHPARMRKREFMDELLNTLTSEPIQEVDNSISDAMSAYLFKSGNPFGVDIISLNIQRGRDHGLRPYNDYRHLVGEPRLTSFQDFGPVGELLKKVYSSVDDVDLWVGGLLEPKFGGSVLGRTFRDIVADQFARLQKGDKYYFEHDPATNPGHFTAEQLNELRKASMSRLICDNSDGYILSRQATNAFKMPGLPGNEYLDCAGPDIPRVDLKYWRRVRK